VVVGTLVGNLAFAALENLIKDRRVVEAYEDTVLASALAVVVESANKISDKTTGVERAKIYARAAWQDLPGDLKIAAAWIDRLSALGAFLGH
jgi:hypothetical protein